MNSKIIFPRHCVHVTFSTKVPLNSYHTGQFQYTILMKVAYTRIKTNYLWGIMVHLIKCCRGGTILTHLLRPHFSCVGAHIVDKLVISLTICLLCGHPHNCVFTVRNRALHNIFCNTVVTVKQIINRKRVGSQKSYIGYYVINFEK